MIALEKILLTAVMAASLSGCYDIKKDMKVEGVTGDFKPISQTFSKNDVIYTSLDKTKKFDSYMHADNKHKTVCGTWNYEIKDDGKKDVPKDYLHQKVHYFTDQKPGCITFEKYKK